ncbi:hypothetical protein HDK77DRAFT_283088 [Phyllosticta capitalensis]|uniref:Uncharacterized protein n=1 Tax=Phyllosticta capitalensis TaxID=121624 RepID=A0ABR1YGA7_9PEZI
MPEFSRTHTTCTLEEAREEHSSTVDENGFVNKGQFDQGEYEAEVHDWIDHYGAYLSMLERAELDSDEQFHDFSSDTTAVDDDSSSTSTGGYDNSLDVSEDLGNADDSDAYDGDAEEDNHSQQDSEATLADNDWASETTFNSADDEADNAAALAANLDAVRPLLPGVDMNNFPIVRVYRYGPTDFPDGRIVAVIQVVLGGELWGFDVAN